MKPTRIAASLALAGLLGGVATPAWPLDLIESFRAALENNREYRIAKARAEAEAEAVPQAMSQLLPTLSATVGRNQVDQERSDANGTRSIPRYPSESDNVQLRQPLLRLRSAFALQQARETVRASRLDLERERQLVGVRVAAAYFDALLARDRQSLLLAQRRNVEARLLAAERAMQAGTGVRTDVDEARAQLDRLNAQDIGIQQNIRVTAAQLEIITGLPVESLALLDSQRLTPELFDPGELQPLLDLAAEKSPEILVRSAQLEATQAAIKAARAEHLPTLDLVASYSRTSSDNPFFLNTELETTSYGFQLTIPIYQGGLVNSKVREAVARSEESRERYLSTINTASVQMRKEYGAIKEGVAKVRALEQALRSADQAVMSNQKGVIAGTRTSLDVLLVDQQRYQVVLDLAAARYDMLMAWVRMNGLMGTMDEEEMARLNGLLAGTTLTAGGLQPAVVPAASAPLPGTVPAAASAP